MSREPERPVLSPSKSSYEANGGGPGDRGLAHRCWGAVVGVFLTTAIEARSRRKIATEQARHARELVAAEQMDEGLIRAQEAIEVSTAATFAESCAEAQRIWGKAWIAYSRGESCLHVPFAVRGASSVEGTGVGLVGGADGRR